MEFDRRQFAIAALAFLSVSCGATASIGGGRADEGWWPQYRKRFLTDEGRIVDTGNGGISHSEGQSYGLLLAYAAGDRQSFAKIFRWTEQNLLRADDHLYAWRYDPRQSNPVADPNNATDGDMMIAWTLALAGGRWGEDSYLARSAQIRAAIRLRCVVDRYGRQLLLPGINGFADDAKVVLNPSYFIWPALDAFAALDGEEIWGKVIADCQDVLTLSRFGRHGLPTDWVAITGPDKVAPAPDRPARFGFDAIRVALYAAMGRRAGLAGNIAAYWRGQIAAGRAVPAWVDVNTDETAPYPVSPGGLAIVDRLLGTTRPGIALSDDYFAASLQMLARVNL